MPQPRGEEIRSYIVPAVLLTLFCPLFGIIAVIWAAQVSRRIEDGEYARARDASQNAKTWCFVTLLGGILMWMVLLLLAVAVLTAGMG